MSASGHRGANLSSFLSPRPRKPRCRAKAPRNHNPRVGGSSPSSGMRSTCKSGTLTPDGHAEYIPRVPRSGFRDLAAVRGVVRAALTVVSPGVSPERRRGRRTERPRQQHGKVPRSRWLGAARRGVAYNCPWRLTWKSVAGVPPARPSRNVSQAAASIASRLREQCASRCDAPSSQCRVAWIPVVSVPLPLSTNGAARFCGSGAAPGYPTK
jgi:hypothetical protein